MKQPTTKIVTYRSTFIHNGHSEQRDKFLIEMYGEEWLNDQKAKGLYGGDWPESDVGHPKPDISGYIEDGKITTIGDVVILERLTDLEGKP